MRQENLASEENLIQAAEKANAAVKKLQEENKGNMKTTCVFLSIENGVGFMVFLCSIQFSGMEVKGIFWQFLAVFVVIQSGQNIIGFQICTGTVAISVGTFGNPFCAVEMASLMFHSIVIMK